MSRMHTDRGRRFEGLVEDVQAILWEADAETFDITYVCRWAEDLLGYPVEEWFRPGFFERIIHPKDRARVLKRCRKAIARGDDHEQEFRIVTADGRILWVLDLTRVHLEDDGQQTLRGVLIDITERKQREGGEAYLAAILEASNDSITSATPEGIVTTWNKGAEALFGYTAEEMVGRSAEVLVPPGMTPVSLYIKWALESGHASYVVPRRRKDGRIVDVAVTLSTMRDSEGRVTGISSIARDVTEAKKLERQLLQAQKMEAIGRLAGGISHDFNNILTAILGNCELLLSDPATPPDVRLQVNEIRDAASIGESIAGKLLEISRPAHAPREVVDVGIILTEMESVLRRLFGEDIRFELRVPTTPMTVRGDPGHLEQVILNLAVNAADAMSGHGTFTIDLAPVAVGIGDPLEQLALQPGAYVSISTSDTGTGIEPDILERIFEPFFSTKGKDGSGLGLSIVYQIVSQEGGDISVESQPGTGTTFRILLPQADAPSTPPKRVNAFGPFAGGTILLAEDDPRVRSVLTRALRDGGYRVIEAEDGAAALRLAEAESGIVDLLVSDVTMPGMTGNELATELLRRRPSLRVLLMSGYARTQALENLLDGGRTEFLQKPFSPSELLGTIGRILETTEV